MTNKERAHLHTSQVAPLSEAVTAVSARRNRTFSLKTSTLTGGKDAIRLYKKITLITLCLIE